MCPDIAASSWDLVAPLFKLSVVSRAYTLKKYQWGLPGAGRVIIADPAKFVVTMQAAVVRVLFFGTPGGSPLLSAGML